MFLSKEPPPSLEEDHPNTHGKLLPSATDSCMAFTTLTRTERVSSSFIHVSRSSMLVHLSSTSNGLDYTSTS